MKIRNNKTIFLKTLGMRKISSFTENPIDFSQLHSDFKLPRNYNTRKIKGFKNSAVPLSFLVRTDIKVDKKIVWSEIRSYFGLKDTTSKVLVKDKIAIKEVIKLKNTKVCWYLLEFPISLGSYLSDSKNNLGDLHQLAAELLNIKSISASEANIPYLNQVIPQQEFLPGCTVGRANAPQDNLWSQKLVQLMDSNGNRIIQEDGNGIILGHIDTGYTNHKELNVNETYDLINTTSVIDNSNGKDPMTSGTSHGTATGSVITSAHVNGDVNDKVAGLAPGISMVSVRALDFVIVLPVGTDDPNLGILVSTFLPSNVLDAMRICMNTGCNVISMSFGGLVSEAVRDIIKEAYQQDIIMCAAAGNCIQVVVEPAALPEVIACAAVGIESTGIPRPWAGTSRGPQVDISAPGENVYIADWENGIELVRPGEGTSFSVPHVAAAAALWLEKHGVSALKSRYNGNSLLGDVFRHVLTESATVPVGWDRSQFGAGVLNLVSLMKAKLPKKADPKGTALGSCTDALGIIGLFLTGNKIPILSETVNVRLDINRIEVRDDGEAFGGSEPYLIETFYRIDGRDSTATLEIDASTLEENGVLNCKFSITRKDHDKSIVYIRQRGDHGNLPTVDIDANSYNTNGPKVINPINRDARWDTSIRPIPLRIILNTGDFFVGKYIIGIPGFTGALTMLMEEDFWSSDIVRIFKKSIRDNTRAEMENIFRELNFSVSLSDLNVSLPQIDAEQIALHVEDAIRQDVVENASWFDLIGAAIDSDELLIQDFTFVNMLQLGNPVSIAPPEANNSHGRWLLRGLIKKR